MNKVLALPKNPQHDPLQFSLFADDDQSYTNTIDLLDVAPRWVLYTDRDVRAGGRFLASVERSFIHNNKTYKLVLRPARIRDDEGEREEYPGAREQLVEQVIRKLATSGNRLREKDGDLLLRFTIYEVRKELKKRNHSFSFAELRESLMILHGAIVEISRYDEAGEGTSKVISSSAFPQISFSETGENIDTTLQFNWLVVEAIKRLQFRQLNYDIIMDLKDAVAIWLFTSLTHRVLYGDENCKVQQISAMDIQRDCGLPLWKSRRNFLARITKAVEVLKAAGVIDEIEETPVFDNRHKVDVVYDLTMTDWFVDEMTRSRTKAITNLDDYRALVGNEPTSFDARLDPIRKQKLRGLRVQRKKVT